MKERESEVASVVSDSLGLRGLWASRLLHPWDFPGKNTGVGCHFLLLGIFPTQELNPGLPHCRHTLYLLSHQGSWYNVGDPGSIRKSVRSPGEGNGNPLQYSCLENRVVSGAWWATVHGVAKSQTRLSIYVHNCSASVLM